MLAYGLIRMGRRAACAVASLAAAVAPASAIVGAGREGGPRAAHVVMVLKRSGAGAGFCSGVVVAPRTVLTAAHCVGGPADTRIFLRDGQGAPVMLEAARVARHPGYRADAVAARARSVDLAVVNTREDLPASLTPVSVAPGPEAVDAALAIGGYGLAREGEPKTGGAYREAEVRLRAPLSGLLLWLDGRGAGACTGDSGGPVLNGAGTLVGIIAFAKGANGRDCGALTQAVRVEPYRGWIEERSSLRAAQAKQSRHAGSRWIASLRSR